MTDDTMTITPPTVDVQGLVARARAINIITTDEEYARAGDVLRGIKALEAQIDETFDPHIARLYDAHRALVKQKRDIKADVVTSEGIVKSLLVDYETARTRALDEQRAAADAQLRVERAERDVVAAQAEAAGDFARADMLRAVSDVLIPAATAPVPKLDGVSFRETWSARVVDFAALVVFCAANPTYLGLLKADGKALDAQARSLRARLRIPGVEAVRQKGVGARR